ncbi:MAG: type I-A CRISPR-associated protein Cas7/Csa2 [Infirmifilum sp.]
MAQVPPVVLSLSARVLVNVEALNMAETVGDVSRHRRAPVVVYGNGRYSVVYVPTVSGESLAHHYQRLLASIAERDGLPVTDMDAKGFFLKYASNNIIGKYYMQDLAKHCPDLPERLKPEDESGGKKGKRGKSDAEKASAITPCEMEAVLVKASTVADVAGFLYTDMLIKRTSRVRFSYMVPAIDAAKQGAVASYPQLHVRYSPEAAKGEQAMYYVESGSALYTLSTVLVASDIAELEYCSQYDQQLAGCWSRCKQELANEKPKRVKAALKALLALIDGMVFGAKRSRYLPVWEVKSLIVAVSKGPVEFVVSPAITTSYAESTARRARVIGQALGTQIKLYMYDGEGLPIDGKLKEELKLETRDGHSEALKAAIEGLEEMLGIEKGSSA